MNAIFRTMTFASILAVGSILNPDSAKAQGFGYGGYPAPGPYGGYYGPSYGAPSFSYYGNGGHDSAPHWHTRQTPFGSYSYYGLGAHDFRPHAHVESPYGVTSYSNGRFGSTQSYSPPAPYVYRPW